MEEKLCCKKTSPLKSLRLYVTGCKFRPGAPPHSPNRRVLIRSSTVQEFLEYFPSTFCGDGARKSTTCLALAQVEEGVLELRTGRWRPQTFKSVTKGQTETPSDTAMWRRSSETARLQTIIRKKTCAWSMLLLF